MDNRFLYYVTASPGFRLNGEAAMIGAAGQKRVPEDYVRDYRITLPPLEQQRAIAAYLNHEMARLDVLAASYRELIERLAEKRRALIAHAVTRGLDPGAPMKDSGVEWLGEIPAHWTITKLKRLAQVRSGVAKGRQLAGNDIISVPYLRVANVQDGYLDLKDIAEIEILENELERYRLQKGDVLMNEGGDADKLGRGAVWDGSIDPCIHQNHVFAIRCENVAPDWLALMIRIDASKAFFEVQAKQTTNLASISSTNLREFPVLLPPLDEQYAIADYIKVQSAALDALRDEAKSALKLLAERRAALIAEAVRGHIDMPVPEMA